MNCVIFVSLLLLAICSVNAAVSRRKLIATTGALPSGWNRNDLADDSDEVWFHLLLKHHNQNELERIFWEVSDPKHANYGRYLTREQIDDLTRPEPRVFADIDAWLAPFRAQMTVRQFSSVYKVRTTVGVARQLFEAEFAWHTYALTGKRVLRLAGPAYVPEHIDEHLDLVAGISEFITDKISPMAYRARRHAGSDDIVVTPSLLKQFYSIPASLKSTNKNNYHGIAAFDDYFSMGALAAFDRNQSVDSASVTRMGPDCLPDDCDQYESDLDVQYLTAVAQDAKTLFIAQGVDYWVLQFCEDVITELKPPPFIFSISYGWSELRQCDIAVANCPKFGYDSKQYVNRTNFDFMKLGTQGISVLVADGDDGAPGFFGSSGNCPLDINTYCPTGGCTHSSTQCNAFTVVNDTSGELCFFPMGLGAEGCDGFLNDNNNMAALNAFFHAQSRSCKLNLEEDTDQLPHVYSACPCSTLKNVSSHGYTFTQFEFSQRNGPVFTADYPTSSPYVTSVGATMFVGSEQSPTEVTCSILRGAVITTGGGFSSFQDQPPYQSAAVQAYLQAMQGNSEFPPSWSYNPSMRAYPDVVFNGHNYLIWATKNQTGDECPCEAVRVDGTSASSPSMAGLVSLLNDHLLNDDKSVLGFLNPLLYQAAVDDPEIFNDIQEGDNRCNRGYCCVYGFPAAKGWDAVTGLGSVQFTKLLDYITRVYQRREKMVSNLQQQ